MKIINNLYLNQLKFKGSEKNAEIEKNKKIALAISGGTILMPLIPLIDGDRYTSTIKNRNVAKYITGMSAIGGSIVASKILYDKYSKTNDKTAYSVILGGCAVPLVMLVDKWSATKGNSIIKNKWFAIGALLGGATGFMVSKINK